MDDRVPRRSDQRSVRSYVLSDQALPLAPYEDARRRERAKAGTLRSLVAENPVNPIAERLTGWAGDDARGLKLDEVFAIFAEGTRELVENPVAKVLREGTVVGMANHTVLRSKAGAETPIDDSAAPIRDESGRLFGVVLVFRDTTDEKRRHVRGEFLARAGEALASSLDYRTTLGTVAQSAVPELADWCAIDILEPGIKAPQQVAVAHVDPNCRPPWAVARPPLLSPPLPAATTAQRAFAAGFQMHVTKPVEPAHLTIVVASLGGRSLEPPS